MSASLTPAMQDAERPDGAAAELRLSPVRSPGTPVLLRRARLADVPALHELLEGFARQGLLLPRTPEQIYRHFREFTVAVDAHGLAGCGALRVYSSRLAEVAALAVAERYRGQGVGRAIVESLLDDAVQLGIERVIALTLQAGFFHRLGFRAGRVEDFPQKTSADCASCAGRAVCRETMVVRDLGTGFLAPPVL